MSLRRFSMINVALGATIAVAAGLLASASPASARSDASGPAVMKAALSTSAVSTAGTDFICPASNVCFFTGSDWNGTVTVIPSSKFPLDTERDLRNLGVTVPWGSVTNKLNNCLELWSAQNPNNVTVLASGARVTGSGITGQEGRGESFNC